MSYTHPLTGHPEAAKRRRDAGRFLRDARVKAGLTQQQVARALGLDYYTMISQIELGKTRVPPDKLQRMAEVLGCDRRDFAKALLRFYDPCSWEMLFGPCVRADTGN